MAESKSRRPAAGDRGPFSIESGLLPLQQAPPRPRTGRIRSPSEARAALNLPSSSSDDVLRASGKPADGQLIAYAISDPSLPNLVAEYALLRVLKRQRNELIPVRPGIRLSLREKSNGLWIVFGSIVRAASGTLVLETLTIAPALEEQLSSPDDDNAHGVTAQLLRLVTPAQLLGSVDRATASRPPLARNNPATRRAADPRRPTSRLRDDQAGAAALRPDQRRATRGAREGLPHPLEPRQPPTN